MAKKNSVEFWQEKATAEVEAKHNPLNIPYEIAIAEAAHVANRLDHYAEPRERVPGFAPLRKRVPAETSSEIRGLIAAAQDAQTRLLTLVDPAVISHGERARWLVDQLEAVVEYVLDDGVEEPADTKLAQIKSNDSQNGQRSAVLAVTLGACVLLAEELKSRIAEEDSSFDWALVDEARALAQTLTQDPSDDRGPTEETTQVRTLRNRTLHLLGERVATVRRAAAYAFREHPEIAREFSSAYERRRRAQHRIRSKTTPPAPAPAAPKPA
jgi:hypothetical protein